MKIAITGGNGFIGGHLAQKLIDAGHEITVLKPGIIYGKGDHMLDHLSHAFHTLPIFGLVGFSDRPVRPTAVEDIVPILRAALVENRMARQTIPVTGPEEMSLRETVRRVAEAVGKVPRMLPMPLFFHKALAFLAECIMKVPLISGAQVRILSEGVIEPALAPDPLPEDLLPKTRFTPEQIRKGLPEAKPFGLADLRIFATQKGSP